MAATLTNANGRASKWPSTQISLLDRVRAADDATAWETFVDLYEPLVYRYCRQRGLQDADARDVVQNVFQKVAANLPAFQYNRQRGRFRGWLGTITFREMRHYRKKAGRAIQGVGGNNGGVSLKQAGSGVEAAWHDTFNAFVLEQALQRVRLEFDALTWAAFEHVWIEERAPCDIAAEIEKPAWWVYKAKFHVLKRLKAEVEYLAEDAALLAHESR